jgi:2-polyprenyl-6-methoxyphenol hydroxylase-like FAD-dependent oxidoreductase
VVQGVELCYLGDLVWRAIVTDNNCGTEGKYLLYVRDRGIDANFVNLGANRTHWDFFLEKDLADFEVGTLQPTNIIIPPQELAKLPQDARNVIESTPLENIVCRYSYDIGPPPQLYDGRVILIGDAAHAKSPTRAIGMTSGWEDGLSLSRHLMSSANIAEALANFQAERLPIVHEYQRTSREMSLKIGRR